jgi:hypothetical protein
VLGQVVAVAMRLGRLADTADDVTTD